MNIVLYFPSVLIITGYNCVLAMKMPKLNDLIWEIKKKCV